MLGEMRESALSLTLDEVSMGEKPECTKEGQLEPKGRGHFRLWDPLQGLESW